MAQQLIDVHGTFMNTKDAHSHDPITTLCEVIDNSVDAGAKNVTILIDDLTLIVADDGRGMTPEKLSESHILTKRSDPESKNGRYGEGLKAFILHFLNEGDKPSTTISAMVGTEPHFVDFKFNSVSLPVVTTPAEIGRTKQIIWNKYKIAEHGTVIQVPINKKARLELLSISSANTICHNLVFQLGRNYSAIDINIKINFGSGISYIVPKISPLADPSEIYEKTYEVQSEKIKITSCWVKDASIQDHILNEIGIKPYPLYNNATSFKKTKDLGGRFISRGKRIISHQIISKKESGNSDVLKYPVQTRHVIDFSPSVTLDSLFGVSVNKSSLDQTRINKDIKKIIDNHIKNAVQHFIKLHPPNPVSESKKVKKKSVIEVQPQEDEEEYEEDGDEEEEDEEEEYDQSATESETESTVSDTPEFTFTMITGADEIIVKYNDEVMYNVPCPKPVRSHFKKILENLSKTVDADKLRSYIESMIETNKIIM